MGLHAYVDGLDHHKFWAAAYSSFGSMRAAIARAAGWPMEPCPLIVGEFRPLLDYDYTADNYQGIWAITPSDILTILFVHSDCDGMISHGHSHPLRVRLDELKTAVLATLPSHMEDQYVQMIEALDVSWRHSADILFQ